MFVPDGDPANGKWKPAEPARRVDALGGWYDAGDQIKFTLNQAATAYHLLSAYRLKPEHFATEHSKSGLPDVLDEARHGLEFLMRVHPDRDTFIIQVGNAEDHNQGVRLPEHDKLDGKRPALCALSRVHMASAAAALALGARTFADVGRTEDAARYGEMARTIYARSLESDTIPTAFERDDVNDFYRDPDPRDQLALAAMELHALTGDRSFLDQAIAFAPRAAQNHNSYMQNHRCFSHQCSGEASLTGRLQRVGWLGGGLNAFAYGENIAWGSGGSGTPRNIVHQWMNSSGHRANILSGRYDEIGIGYSKGTVTNKSANGSVMTTDFGWKTG
jgi:hypothetical protein